MAGEVIAAGPDSPKGRSLDNLRSRVVQAFRALRCREEIVVFSSGYQHRPGETDVCVDAELKPRLGRRLAFLLFSGDVKVDEVVIDVPEPPPERTKTCR